MKTFVKITLQNGTEIELQTIQINLIQHHLSLKDLQKEFGTSLFLKKMHPYLNTLLEATGATDSVVLYIDEIEKKLAGASYILNPLDAPFAIQTIEENILILPYPLSFELEKILFINFSDKPNVKKEFSLVLTAKDTSKISFPCQYKNDDNEEIILEYKESSTPDILFFEVKHNQSSTVFDLANFYSCELWYFDSKNKFTGKSNFSPDGKDSCQITTKAHYIAFIPTVVESDDNINLLKDFECDTFQLVEKKWGEFNMFIPWYGMFPYVIIRMYSAIYMQIPIHINKINDVKKYPGTHLNDVPEEVINDSIKFRELLIAHTQKIKDKIDTDRKISSRIVLVMNTSEAYYFENGTMIKSDSIPSGGTLMTQGKKFVAMNRKHYL